jgi:hypothetical protein
MAARTKKIRHDDETRAKIQAAMIIDRLQKGLKGEIDLNAQQVSIGLGLLRKVLPDLAQTDMNATHDVSDPLRQLLRNIDGRTRGLPKN